MGQGRGMPLQLVSFEEKVKRGPHPPESKIGPGAAKNWQSGLDKRIPIQTHLMGFVLPNSASKRLGAIPVCQKTPHQGNQGQEPQGSQQDVPGHLFLENGIDGETGP